MKGRRCYFCGSRAPLRPIPKALTTGIWRIQRPCRRFLNFECRSTSGRVMRQNVREEQVRQLAAGDSVIFACSTAISRLIENASTRKIGSVQRPCRRFLNFEIPLITRRVMRQNGRKISVRPLLTNDCVIFPASTVIMSLLKKPSEQENRSFSGP